jgi:hypothetical protein
VDILGYQGQLTSALLQNAMYNHSIGQIWKALNYLEALAELEGVKVDFASIDTNPLNPSVSDILAMEHLYAKNLKFLMRFEKDKLSAIRTSYRNKLKVVGPTKPDKPKPISAPSLPSGA